jgi:Ni/Fe-hydrogenase 1 B-type cytochrome subunit
VTQLMVRQYIYDAVQRVLHWWLALSTVLLVITGLLASNQDAGSEQVFTWSLHMLAGRVLIVGLSGRLLWGVIGPAHARFNAFIHISAWIDSLKSRKMLSADTEFGHHPQASMSYLTFYGLIVIMCITGLSLAAIIHGEGPLAERLLDDFTYLGIIRNIHEYSWWAIGFFAVTHVGALIFHEWHDQIPIAQSMISGFQYRTKKNKGEKTNDHHK